MSRILTMATTRLSRRAAVGGLSAGVAGTILAACTPQAGGRQAGSGGQAGAKQVTLEFWTPWAPNAPDGQLLQNTLLPEFEKANPGFKVNYTQVATSGNTQASEKLLTAINAGTPPDVNYFDRFIVTSWAAQGFLTDISDYAKRDNFTQTMFLKEAWDEATWAGKLYATPFTTDFRMLYYNKAHFQEAGLDPNKPPKTIAELDETAEKLTRRDGAKFSRMGFVPWAYQGWLYTWGWLWGGEFYDPKANKVTANDPKIVQALTWMVSYAQKYGIETVDNFTAAFRSQTGFQGNDQHAFVNGLLSMVADGDWQIAIFKNYMKPEQFQQFDVVELPQAPGGPRTSSWGGGWSIVLPKGVKNKDQAWVFARWWATEGQKIYVQALTRVPTLLSLFDEKQFQSTDPRWRKFLTLRDIVRFRPNIPVGQMLWTELATATDDAIHGKGTPKQLLDGVTERVNRELAKFSK
jgi:multiple sugar transport system substrate-binding protein